MPVYDTGATWITWTTTSGTATTDSWICWNGTGTTTTVSYGTGYAPIPETPEAREHRECAEREREEEAQAAVARAEELLLSALSTRQRSEYRRCKHFHVRGPSGQRYRIERKRVSNIVVLQPNGSPLRRLCVHPIEAVPDEDTMLAQKLYLESEHEQDLLALANVHAA